MISDSAVVYISGFAQSTPEHVAVYRQLLERKNNRRYLGADGSGVDKLPYNEERRLPVPPSSRTHCL